MNLFRNLFFNRIFLFLLITSGYVPLLTAENKIDTNYPAEERISEKLYSPLITDLSLGSAEYAKITTQDDFLFIQKMAFNKLKNLSNEISAQSRIKNTRLLHILQTISSPCEGSILKKIDRTITPQGKVYLWNILNQADCPKEIALNRQHFIKHLTENPDLLADLREQLSKINQDSRIDTSDKPSPKLTIDEIQNKQIHLNYIKEFIDNKGIPQAFRDNNNDLINLLLSNIFLALIWAVLIYLCFREGPKLTLILSLLLMLAITPLMLLSTKVTFTDQFFTFNLTKKFAGILTGAESLHEILSANSKTENLYPNIFKEQSETWLYIKDMLNDERFAEDSHFNYFPTNPSSILEIFINLKDTYKDFTKIIQFYSEVDAYCSIAQMIVDHESITNNLGQPVKCCFAQFSDPESAPIDINNYWDPLSSRENMKLNSLRCGKTEFIAEQNQDQKLEKMMSLRALLTTIKFAKTFGIAFASSCKIPFSKEILTYLDSV